MIKCDKMRGQRKMMDDSGKTDAFDVFFAYVLFTTKKKKEMN